MNSVAQSPQRFHHVIVDRRKRDPQFKLDLAIRLAFEAVHDEDPRGLVRHPRQFRPDQPGCIAHADPVVLLWAA